MVLVGIKYYRGNKNTRSAVSRASERAPSRVARAETLLSRIDTCVGLKSATGDSGFYGEISVETLCRAKWPLRFVPEIKTERVATGEGRWTRGGEPKGRKTKGCRGDEEERGRNDTGDGPREDKFCNPLWSAS